MIGKKNPSQFLTGFQFFCRLLFTHAVGLGARKDADVDFSDRRFCGDLPS